MKRQDVFRGGMATLGLSFNREMSEPLLDTYWTTLEELTDAELTTAMGRAVKECEFFPPPAKLLALAGHKPRDVAADALEAWGAVRKAIDQYDYTDGVDFGPLVNAVVHNLGGWQELCALSLPDLDVWARKRFVETYAALAAKDPATLHGDPFRGALGGAPIHAVAIGGKLPPRRIAGAVPATSDLVRELADAKS